MSATDWGVTVLLGTAGFFLNESLRNTLQARGHDQLAAGVAIVASATLFGGALMVYVAATR